MKCRKKKTLIKLRRALEKAKKHFPLLRRLICKALHTVQFSLFLLVLANDFCDSIFLNKTWRIDIVLTLTQQFEQRFIRLVSLRLDRRLIKIDLFDLNKAIIIHILCILFSQVKL